MKPFARILRIGTRGSRLALAQSHWILQKLRRTHPHRRFKLHVIKTTGDEYQTVELFRQNKIGVFTKQIEDSLLCGRIDAAVHSLKDLPTQLADGLCLAAVPVRLNPRDVLISKKRHTIDSLPFSASVATGSPRRKRQLLLLRPDLILHDLRGNLDTRVRRVIQKKDFDAVVLAEAGLERLGKFSRYSTPIPPSRMFPAVGQAALGIETRSDDSEMIAIVQKLNHAPSRLEIDAERAFLARLHGGCRVPVGIFTVLRAGRMFLSARVFSVRTCHYLEDKIQGPAVSAEKLGRRLAEKFLKKGAAKLLAEARREEGSA